MQPQLADKRDGEKPPQHPFSLPVSTANLPLSKHTLYFIYFKAILNTSCLATSTACNRGELGVLSAATSVSNNGFMSLRICKCQMTRQRHPQHKAILYMSLWQQSTLTSWCGRCLLTWMWILPKSGLHALTFSISWKTQVCDKDQYAFIPLS